MGFQNRTAQGKGNVQDKTVKYEVKTKKKQKDEKLSRKKEDTGTDFEAMSWQVQILIMQSDGCI